MGSSYSPPAAGGGFANPMTTTGDIIVAGSGGAAQRLALGPSQDILTSNGTTAIWSTAPAQGILGEAAQFASGTVLTNTNNGELWQATAAGAALAFAQPTQATQVKWLTVDPSTFGYSLNVGQLGTLGGAGLPLSTVTATTSLPVNALANPVVNGTQITTVSGSHSQTWTVTSGAAAGSTSIAVSSQVANFAYPSGTTINSATAVWAGGTAPSYSAASSGAFDSYVLVPNYALTEWVVSPFEQTLEGVPLLANEGSDYNAVSFMDNVLGTPAVSTAFRANSAATEGTFAASNYIDAVNDYGADPTNTNDSTTAIQNALNAAATNASNKNGKSCDVYLQAGRYKIATGPLTIASGVRLFASGNPTAFTSQSTSSPCILDATSTASGNCVSFGITTNSTATLGPRLENISVINTVGLNNVTPGTPIGRGVAFYGTGNARVLNCTVSGFQYGFYWDCCPVGSGTGTVGCNQDSLIGCRVDMPFLPSSGSATTFGIYLGGKSGTSAQDLWDITLYDIFVNPDNTGNASSYNQVGLYIGNLDGCRFDHYDFDATPGTTKNPCAVYYDYGNGVSTQRPTGTVINDIDPRCSTLAQFFQTNGTLTNGNQAPNNIIQNVRPQNCQWPSGPTDWTQSFSSGALARLRPGVRLDMNCPSLHPKIATPGGATPIASWVSGTPIANPYPFPVFVSMTITISTASTFSLQYGGAGQQVTIFTQSATGTYSTFFILNPHNEASGALAGNPPYAVGGTFLTPTFTSGDATVTWNWTALDM